MPTQDETLPPNLRRRLDRWLSRWGAPSLTRTLRIEYSPRLKRAFGRCYQDKRLIRLTPSLQGSQSFLLAEIVCHEAAHAAVYEVHGHTARPHGKEWEDMMRVAGFEPRVRIPVVVRTPQVAAAKVRVLYLHHCPNCDLSRRAARPMHQWRCRTCAGSGDGGRLEIRREREHGNQATKRRAAASGSSQRRRAAASHGKSASPAQFSGRARRVSRSRAR